MQSVRHSQKPAALARAQPSEGSLRAASVGVRPSLSQEFEAAREQRRREIASRIKAGLIARGITAP